MGLGVRGRLFVVSLLLVLAVGTASGLYLESSIRSWLEDRLELTLVAQAQTMREAIDRPLDIARMDVLADRMGEAADVRVTIIDDQGRVVGDSSVATAQVSNLENHGQRPEVLAAIATGQGVSRRHSATLDIDFLYVAVPFDRGVVRVSMPLEEIDTTITRLRLLILFAGIVGMIVAVAMSFMASHLMSRTLRRMVTHSRELVRGAGPRLQVASKDEYGRLAGSINAMADELEETLATLAAERSRFETVLDSMSEAVIVVVPNGRISLSNAAALRLLGPNEEATSPLAELASRAHEKARVAELSIDLDTDDGVRTVLARARPLATSGDTVIVMLDVTEMRRLERIRKDFVGNVSHELRTPVSVIRANAETLLDGGLDDGERARAFVEALHRNSERLSRIIADLLELSRIEAGRYQLDLRTIDIKAAAELAIETVEPTATEASIEVLLDADRVDVTADRKALNQVLTNLLENAVKYTESGGHVRVAVSTAEDTVRISVEDDGLGIAKKHRQRIFERFYRVDRGRSRQTGGTGLGLAIVKHFVESMRGRVGVEPNEPTGSIFWFELPRPHRTRQS